MASYITKENDTNLVDYALAPLQMRSVPRDIARNLHALSDLKHIMLTLVEDARTGNLPSGLSASKSAVYPTLCEKWPAVIKGLRIVMLDSWKSNDSLKATGDCVDLFKAILLVYRDEGYADELFSLPSTVDFVYLLLCRAEVSSGGEHAVRAGYRILSVLSLCLESERTGPSNIALRLSTVSKATRSRVVGALVRRAQEVADHGCNKRLLWRGDLHCEAPKALHVLMICTDYLLRANPSLFTTFLQHNFLFVYAKSLCRLAESAASAYDSSLPGARNGWQEFWSVWAQAITHFVSHVAMKRCPNRTHGLSQAIEGGLITSCLVCLTTFAPTG